MLVSSFTRTRVEGDTVKITRVNKGGRKQLFSTPNFEKANPTPQNKARLRSCDEHKAKPTVNDESVVSALTLVMRFSTKAVVKD